MSFYRNTKLPGSSSSSATSHLFVYQPSHDTIEFRILTKPRNWRRSRVRPGAPQVSHPRGS